MARNALRSGESISRTLDKSLTRLANRKSRWSNWLSRHPFKVETAGSNPVRDTRMIPTEVDNFITNEAMAERVQGLPRGHGVQNDWVARRRELAADMRHTPRAAQQPISCPICGGQRINSVHEMSSIRTLQLDGISAWDEDGNDIEHVLSVEDLQGEYESSFNLYLLDDTIEDEVTDEHNSYLQCYCGYTFSLYSNDTHWV